MAEGKDRGRRVWLCEKTRQEWVVPIKTCQMFLVTLSLISHSYVKETQVFLAVSLHGTVTQFNSLKKEEERNQNQRRKEIELLVWGGISLGG